MHNIVENHFYIILLIFLSVVFAGNIPVGTWRSRLPRFSRPWARCIYIPILVNILLRRLIGLTLNVVPLVLLAVLMGQLIGGNLETFKGKR